MLRLRLIVPVVAFALTTMAAAAPSIISAADGPPAVTIRDGGDPTTWGYAPVSTTVAAGQTVTWTNSGEFPHDAASTDGSWKTPLLNTGGSASVTFATPGTYMYICTPHPWMQGTIVVTAAPAPAVNTPAQPTAAPVVDVSPPPSNPPAATDMTPGQPSDGAAPDPATDAGN